MHATSLGLNSTTNGVEVDTFVTTGASINTTGGRSGQGALKILNPTSGTRAGFNIRYTNAAVADNWARFYLTVTTRPNVRTTVMGFHQTTSMTTTSDRVGAIELDTDGTLILTYYTGVGTRTTVGSASSALTNGTRYRVEIYMEQISGSNTLTARVDGVNFADSGATLGLLGTGVCARFGANLEAETCTAGEWEISDVVIHNSSGATQNTWPGDGALYYLFPDSAGDNAEGLIAGSSPAATAWDSVDEHPPDDGVTQFNLQTDVSATSADPDRLDVNVTEFATTPTSIAWVAVGARLKPLSAANCSWVPRIKSQASGTVGEGTTVVVTGSAFVTNDDTAGTRQYKLFRTTDPQTSAAWAASKLTGLQIGARAPDGNPDVMLSALWALVEHVPGAAVTGGMTPRRAGRRRLNQNTLLRM